MADSGSDDEQQTQIAIKVKTTAEAYDIKVKEKATVGKVKSVLSEMLKQPAEKLCLIFSGKILKDHETIDKHGIKDGMAVHLVVREKQPKSAGGTSSSATSSAVC
ncbi:hypothetical protein AB6A40_011103 [Gnathostoma spinigerum]|uniref:Ubiquitin-like domain-containing protein n=1 Tax=Gnathostoma spinigerum TaxID=75299 RepID=A0ABD6F2T4_9BILA